MTLVRWRPVRGLLDIREDVDRLFDEFFFDLPAVRYSDGGFWSPRVDISETDDELIITAEVPGMEKGDLKVSVEDGVLTLKGEKKHEKELKDANCHRIERRYGTFQRSFAFPAGVEPDKVRAKYEDGVLRVTLPKAEEVEPKEIEVKVE